MSVTIKTRERKNCTSVYLSYNDLSGKRRRPTIGKARSREELNIVMEMARAKAKRIELELLEGRHAPNMGHEPIDTALNKFLDHMEARQACGKAKPRTVELYYESMGKWRRYLKTTKAVRLRDVDYEIIVGYIKWMKHCKPNTIHGELTRLQRVFEHCNDRGALAYNPCKHPIVKDLWPTPTRHDRAFIKDEFEALLEHCQSGTKSPQATDYTEFFLLLGETGLRLGEGRMLRWCDLALISESGFLRVDARPGWAPKTESSIRSVPLSLRVLSMLRARFGRRTTIDESELVFPRNFTNRSVNQMLNRVLRKAEIAGRDNRGEKLTVHSLRHYFATRLVEAGVNPATARDLLGHDSIVTTNRYFNVPLSSLKNAIAHTFEDSASAQSAHETVRKTTESCQKLENVVDFRPRAGTDKS